jgi:PiT family inorganic phosphate transporter
MNDAQKTMGIIAIVLFSNGYMSEFHIPIWVEIICYLVIGAGTMSGGWRIVKTMGTKITKLEPVGGFCAETAAATAIISASLAGIPVVPLHDYRAIMGVGATRRLSLLFVGALRSSIVWAWLLTIPVTAIISMMIYLSLRNL